MSAFSPSVAFAAWPSVPARPPAPPSAAAETFGACESPSPGALGALGRRGRALKAPRPSRQRSCLCLLMPYTLRDVYRSRGFRVSVWHSRRGRVAKIGERAIDASAQMAMRDPPPAHWPSGAPRGRSCAEGRRAPGPSLAGAQEVLRGHRNRFETRRRSRRQIDSSFSQEACKGSAARAPD